MAEVQPDLREVAQFIAREIIRGIMKYRRKEMSKPSLSQIGKQFTDLVGEDNFEAFKRCLQPTSNSIPVYHDATSAEPSNTASNLNEVWRRFVKSTPCIKCKKGQFSFDFNISPRVNNIKKKYPQHETIVDSKMKMLSEMFKLLFDGGLWDINYKGLNGNTVLHLLASLPTETRETCKFQIDLLKLLVEKKPDCSIKNDQEMTPLHIIVGNFYLDPNNGFVLSEHRGLNCEENMVGRFEKLSCMENIIAKPFKVRGPNGNSILHEWVIYRSTGQDLVPDLQIDNSIGNWIISIADVPPNVVNDHGCTPLHYAFTDKLIQFLCKNGANTRRQNVDGDTPLMYMIKHGLLRAFVDKSLLSKDKLESILAIEFSIQLTDPQSLTNSKRDVDFSVSFKVLEEEGFDFFERDNSNRNCFDYLLLLVGVLVSMYVTVNINCSYLYCDCIKDIIQQWIMKLVKTDRASLTDGNAKEKTLHTLIEKIFECRSSFVEDLESMLIEGVKELLAAGADPNYTCGDGNTLLHFSCNKAKANDPLHEDLLKTLCINGADQDKKNPEGLSPIEFLYIRQLNDIASVLSTMKPRARVVVSIQSQRYKDQLDQLSRKMSPDRIEEYRYDPDYIGKGSMGCVYLGIDENCSREVALKRIDKTSFRKEHKAEIEALNKLGPNRNVINYYSVKEDQHFLFIVLELMDGDLDDLVKTKTKSLDSMQCQLAKDILRGLEFIHEQNIIHRDLKPGNILYRENPQLCLKLADFGLAKHLNVSSTLQTSSVYGTSSTSMCGTRGWMAPELVNRTQKTPTKESDMFALGMVLHFLFSKGFHPFHSASSSLLEEITTDTLRPHELEGNISKVNVQIHRGLNIEQRDLVRHLLNKDARERPRSKGLMKQHFYFWSSLKKVHFMCKVGDQHEVAKPSSTPTSTFGSQLQNSPFGRGLTNWSRQFPDLYKEVASRRRYNTSSVVDLIRFFRNCYAHFEERSQSHKEELLNDAFFVKFPDFFLTVCEEVYNQGWPNPGSGKDWILRMLEEMD